MANNDSGMAFVAGFLFGGALGVGLGLLLAPKSGAETRGEIVAHGDALRQRAEDMAAQITHNVTPAIDSLRHQVTPAVDVVRHRMGMEKAAEGMEEATEGAGAPEAAESMGAPEPAETKGAAAT